MTSQNDRELVFQCVQSMGNTGVSQENLQNTLKNLTQERMVAAINLLLRESRIAIMKDKEGNLMYCMPNLERVKKTRGLNRDERLAFSLIEEAGSKGIWARHIKLQSGIQQQQFNKVLRSLESKKLVKWINPVSNKRKKVYLLFDVKPDRSLVGGPWVTDAEFDKVFFDSLADAIHRVASRRGFANLSTLHRAVANVSNVPLGKEDVQTVIDTLVYDGRFERYIAPNQSSTSLFDDDLDRFLYRPAPITPKSVKNGLVKQPCGVCPVFEQCCEGG
eukprot:CAMPEP_0201555448 /NCGR_PEP_ID=MMETSP0173_2-20130828/49031_1 /ASSEMBLY_ACC=CAM_ASM_000268 /TAXON_ID=218659 /ORGANISM="Vexillifera sp., Strain DIVA3 564/2" /LENGTH=274 /DNA_ID=CAMNT_0047967243 /DNA_START=36 /DNA_END=856 /DNA_ORIENTATION=+